MARELIEDNKIEFVLRPSQWLNTGYYLLLIVMMYIFWEYPIVWIPFVLLALYKTLDIYYWRFEIMETSFVERRGVFNVTRYVIRYHRIKSIMETSPFYMRLLGLSSIYISTAEQFKANILMIAIPDGPVFAQYIYNKMLYWRSKEDVRDIDLFDTN